MAIDLTKIGIDALAAVMGLSEEFKRPSRPRVDNTSGSVGRPKPGVPSHGAWGSKVNLYNGMDATPR